jgi:outer membrane protein OmpA-like peptidoglycan-associated protein
LPLLVSAADGVVSSRDIEAALAPRGAPAEPATHSAADAPRTRGIVIKAAAEERRGVVDLNVPFELNSAALAPRAMAQLQQLDAALNSAALAQARFLVAGHTDSSGEQEYNRRLSLRRAETVRDWLAAHGVEARRLETAGYGSERPVTPQDPRDPANRRVEIRRLGAAP